MEGEPVAQSLDERLFEPTQEKAIVSRWWRIRLIGRASYTVNDSRETAGESREPPADMRYVQVPETGSMRAICNADPVETRWASRSPRFSDHGWIK